MKILLSVIFLCAGPAFCGAQAASGSVGWDRVRHLHAGTHVHVAGDKQSKTCVIDLVDEATLRCSKGTSQYSFAREDVKSVKLTRYGRSTLVGALIGAGAGAGIGAIAGRVEAPPQPNQYLDFSDIDREAATVIGMSAGLIAGAAIGGPTDFLRGPTIYRRP